MLNISNIIQLGTKNGSDNELNQKIKTTNIISLSTIFIVLLFNLIVNIISFNWFVLFGLLSHTSILTISLFLNSRGNHKLARLLIPIASIYFTNVLALLLGEESFVEFVLIPILLLPFMIHTKDEIIQKIGFIIFLLLDWFLLKEIYNHSQPIYDVGEHTLLIQSIFIFLAFSWTVVMLLVITNGNNSGQED